MDGVRNHDLAFLGGSHHSRAQMDGDAAQLAVDHLALAGVNASPNAQAKPPAVDWSEAGFTPQDAGGRAKVVVISEEDIITATPKKAWNGIAANSSRILIT